MKVRPSVVASTIQLLVLLKYLQHTFWLTDYNVHTLGIVVYIG